MQTYINELRRDHRNRGKRGFVKGQGDVCLYQKANSNLVEIFNVVVDACASGDSGVLLRF